jgi:signal transduction histidine kinase
MDRDQDVSDRIEQVLRNSPVAALLAAPGVAAAGATALAPDRALSWIALAVAVTVLLAGELSRQLAGGGRAWSREIVHAVEHTSVLERRAAVAEQIAERRRNETSPSTGRTFRLFTQLVNAEEATRAQMAAELHDAVAQTLSTALMQMRHDRHEDALGSLEDAEEQLRGVMARIRPPELSEGNLARAVADLTEDLRRRYGVEIAVAWTQASVALPSALATTFYRFVQEALLNAVVHADGVDVRLDVELDAAELKVTVSDGGPGFDPAAVVSTDGRHVGLKLARERARLAGGAVDVWSKPGAGTRATLRLPVGVSIAPERPSVRAPERVTA